MTDERFESIEDAIAALSGYAIETDDARLLAGVSRLALYGEAPGRGDRGGSGTSQDFERANPLRDGPPHQPSAAERHQ